MLNAGATASSRSGAFPARDEGLDDGGIRKAQSANRALPKVDRTLCSTNRSAQQTAAALGCSGIAEEALSDIDHGRWSGQALTEIHAREAEALELWLADPSIGAPEGETMAQVVERVGRWLDARSADTATILAITHAAVIRAAMAYALTLPVQATFRIDIAPLSTAILSFNRIWRLQELRPL